MDSFINFLANNYVWFLIVSLILIFALIGYLVDLKETKTGKRIRPKKEELKVIDFTTVDHTQSLKQSVKEESPVLDLNKKEEPIVSKIDDNLEAVSLETEEAKDSSLPEFDFGNTNKDDNNM